MKRLSFDEYFLEVAKTVSKRSGCVRSQVGAVLVDSNHRIVGTGYNSSPSGSPDCFEGACPRGRLSYEDHPSNSDYGNCISNHAEFNAITYARWEDREGSTLYITRRPCTDCHELILSEGIKEIVWLTPDGQLAREMQFH